VAGRCGAVVEDDLYNTLERLSVQAGKKDKILSVQRLSVQAGKKDKIAAIVQRICKAQDTVI